MDINKVTLIGRLMRKPESTKSESGQGVATFTIATNYIWRDFKTKERKDETQFHRVVVWGKLADIAAAYLAKGSRVYIEGRLSRCKFTDRKGARHWRTDVLGDEIILLGVNSSGRKSPAIGEAASPSATG
jgi:single-strand DNA-binding protein